MEPAATRSRRWPLVRRPSQPPHHGDAAADRALETGRVDHLADKLATGIDHHTHGEAEDARALTPSGPRPIGDSKRLEKLTPWLELVTTGEAAASRLQEVNLQIPRSGWNRKRSTLSCPGSLGTCPCLRPSRASSECVCSEHRNGRSYAFFSRNA